MRYVHILGATDFSALGDLAIQRAAEIAYDQRARLTIAHVLPEPIAPSPLVPRYYDIKTDEARLAKAKADALAMLRERVRPEIRDSDAISISYEVRVGDPAAEILSLEAQLHPDLIVLSTHGRRGFVHLVLGSVTERVLRGARADVLAVKPQAASTEE